MPIQELTVAEIKNCWGKVVREQTSNEKIEKVHPFFQILRGFLLESLEKELSRVSGKKAQESFKTENEKTLYKDGRKLIEDKQKTVEQIALLASTCNNYLARKKYCDSELTEEIKKLYTVAHPEIYVPYHFQVEKTEKRTLAVAAILKEHGLNDQKEIKDYLTSQATVATYPVMHDKVLLNTYLQLTIFWIGIFCGLPYKEVEVVLYGSGVSNEYRMKRI